ncbi:MAG: hypothetical protein HWN70_13190 [Desulfobacterales bacterium]|nr:hypothetical protein [Desulfobacterales bacterium]
MERDKDLRREVEKAFLALSPEEREAVISHGVAVRLSDLRKRLFLAESKIRHFEEKYKITLAQVEAHGLADDADYEMHEDYVMWRHWAGAADKAKTYIVVLEKIAQHGLYLGESAHAGH